MNFISNGIKIYNLTSVKEFPAWISKSRRLKKNEDYQKRIELIQEFEFPVSTTCLQQTPDNQYVVATGVYPPQVRIFDLHELSLHHERHITTEAIQMSIFSSDYSQMAFLRDQRYLEFHQKGGGYYTMRVPKPGRDMVYDAESCSLVICCAGPSVYRLNLNLGQYMSPLKTDLDNMTVCARNPVHGLLGFGDESGKLQFFDPRTRDSIATIDMVNVLKPTLDTPFEISALTYAEDGLTLGIGTTHGHVPIYDLRTSTPSIVKLHQNQLPIKNLKFHTSNNVTRVFSADPKVLKIWDHKESSGRVFCSIGSQENHDISSVCPLRNSGIVMMGGSQAQINAYYIPDLGPAPKWGSFIENITEELSTENSSSIYEDYKFVTRDELAKLGMTKLLGTEYLKAYMHGYWVNTELYLKMRSIAQPYNRKEHLQQKAMEIIQNDTRISVKRNLPTVNGKSVAKILGVGENGKHEDDSDNEKKLKGKKGVIIDDRFSALATNPDFEIEGKKKTYQLNNDIKTKNVAAHFEKVQGENSSEEEEQEEEYDESENDNQSENGNRKRKLDFYEIKTGHNPAIALRDQLSSTLRDSSTVPLSKRATQFDNEMKFAKVSEPTNLEFTYEPKKKKKNPAKPKVATKTPQAPKPQKVEDKEDSNRRQLFGNDIKTEQWRKSREFRVAGLKKGQR
eukprot:TRINITY_DN1689_c0_g1_i2.p1 TRINITY_DN1689_c0_g1~~TRINITY_DN1689_c0_g1_i2.p1  ORF type:complete len:678 (+),score=129.77 TRINITY_DN1689_c0_g1_i2:454-2487(+)